MIVFERTCPKCLLIYLSNEQHQCPPQKSKPAKKPTTSPVTKTAASSVSSPSSRRIVTPPEPVTTPPVITRNYEQPPVTTPARNYAVITGSEEARRVAEVQRVTEWRKNPENRAKYNAYQRKRRAAARQKAPE